MTNRQSNPYAKILAPRPPISRRVPPPRNNLRKIKPHGTLPVPRVPNYAMRDMSGQSHRAVAPVPPKTSPLNGLLRKAGAGLVTQTSSQRPDWPGDWNATSQRGICPSSNRVIGPYESVSTRHQSRESLTNGNALTPLSTSSKVNTWTQSTKTNVNNVYNTTKSTKIPKKHITNTQESTHRQSQAQCKPPPRPRKRGTHPRKISGPSSPKGKRSPIRNVKRPPALPLPLPSLERPTSPQQPSLNPKNWKCQVRLSAKQNLPPEHAPRPADPVFPLVSQSHRDNLSPRLRKHDCLHTRFSPPAQSGNVESYNTRGNDRSNAVTRVVHHPSREQHHVTGAEKPDLHLDSEDDIPLSQLYDHPVKPRGESSPKPSTVNTTRQSAVETLVTKQRPIPPKEKTPRNHTSKCKSDAARPSITDTVEVFPSTNLGNAQGKHPSNSVPHGPSATASVPPPKKRRVFSDMPISGNIAPTCLDLRQMEMPNTLTNSRKVSVSPISITEAPFEISFEDPTVARLRTLNGGDNMCLLGNSVKTAVRSVSTAPRRRGLSFERRKQKVSQLNCIANPLDRHTMKVAVEAVNTRSEKHV